MGVPRKKAGEKEKTTKKKNRQISRMFEHIFRKLRRPTNARGRKQEERDRGLARALVYEARAKAYLGEDGILSGSRRNLFPSIPSEEPRANRPRRWLVLHRKKTLCCAGDAFAVPDAHGFGPDRSADRAALGDVPQAASFEKVWRRDPGGVRSTSALVAHR